MDIWFWIILILIIAAVVYVIPAIVISVVIYTILLVRTSKKKWGRECSIPDDKEYQTMFDRGIEWDKKYSHLKRQVEVYSGKLHLVGEYFDFGGDTAVILIAGRMESLLYSYYFAEPYRRLGYNVLVIDNRSHGESDGVVCSLGFREYKDILEWSRLLTEERGNKSVVLHGICIGSSVALFAMTDSTCPDYIKAMAADGMYVNFAESFKNHMIEDKRPKIAPIGLVFLLMRVFSKADVVHDGPYFRIDKMKKPILFLHSLEDTYSLPEKAQLLYDKCGSENKRIVWFEKGAHSRIRINAEQKYDDTIVEFFSQENILD